ncbi:MAG: carboxypeptidase regulatory-like domain-containing protein, partial [Planctomycetes bacterium]|nr:carboxypeptidase regulatory-like domain-containing protein [Planctomycetota bacterium]
ATTASTPRELAGVDAQVAPDAPAPAAASLPALPAGGLQGIVRDPAGKPLAGVTVELLGFPEGMSGKDSGLQAMRSYLVANGQWDLMFNPRASAATDAEGRFRLEQPEEQGPWQLRLAHPAFVVTRTQDFQLEAYPAAGASFGLVPGANLEVQARTPDGAPIAAWIQVALGEEQPETLGQSAPFPLHADPTHALRALNEDASGSVFAGGFSQVKVSSEATEEVTVLEDAPAVDGDAPPEATASPEAAASPASTGPKLVTGLPPGTHTVTARATGYAHGSAEVQLAAGTTQSLTVSLQQGLTLSGRVIDRAGKPIPEATVTGVALGGKDAALAMAQQGTQVSAVSDAEGRFTLTGLEDSPYYLMPNAEGYQSMRQGAPFGGMPESYRAGRAEPVTLTLQALVAIQGRVRGPSGEALATVEVTARGKGTWANSSQQVAPDGSFTLSGLAPGRYDLSAAGGGWVSFEAQSVSVGADGARGVELELRQGLTVEVDVACAGQPVSGASLNLSAGEEGMFGGLGRAGAQASTDASGEGSLAGVAPGEYRLSVTCEGFAPAEVPVGVTAQGAARVRVELLAGATLAGRVLNADGTPAADGVLYATRTGKSFSKDALEATTDAEGAFTLEGLAAGSYDLHLMHMSGLGTPQIKQVGSFTATPGQTTTQTFRLEAPEQMGTLSGRLLQGDEPLAMRPVQARGDGGNSIFDGGFLWFMTDAEGRFENASVRPGVYRVSSSGTEEVRVEVRAGQASEVELRIKAGVIAGRVVDQLGAPLADATVYLRPATPSHEFDMLALTGGGRVTTDASGAFRVPELPPGTYRLAATGVGIGSSVPQEVVLGDDESRTGLEVRLEPAPEVRVQVLGADGAPLTGAEVGYYAADLGHSYELTPGAQTATNAQGVALFDELTPGDYVFSATSAVSGAAVSGRVTLGPGDERSLTLRLSPPGTLVVSGPPRTALRLTLAESLTPPPNAMANLFVSTNAEGSCTIDDLPAGDYAVEATAADGRTVRWRGAVPSGGEGHATLR